MATLVYYRRRVLAGAGGAIVLGILPVAAAAFLACIIVRSLQAAPASQIWSLIGVVLLGLVMPLSRGSCCTRRSSGSRRRATRQSADRLRSPGRGARPGTV